MARLNPNLNYKVARASDGVRRFDRPDGSLPDEVGEPSGSVLTITGSGFGSGPNVVLFDRFMGAHLDTVPLTGAEIGAWDHYANTPGGVARFAEYAGRSWFSSRDAARISESGNFRASMVWLASAPFTEFRISHRLRIPAGFNLPTAVAPNSLGNGLSGWKPNWMGNNVNGVFEQGQGKADICLPTHIGSGSFLVGGNTNGPRIYTSSIGTTGSLAFGPWSFTSDNFFSYYQGNETVSGAGDAPMELISVSDNGCKLMQGEGDPYRSTGSHSVDLKSYSAFKVSAYYGNQPNSDWTNVWPLHADIHLAIGANARARVLLGNAPSLTDCTQIYDIPPDSWTDTEIKVTVREWEKYPHYHVIKADGSVVSGSTGFGGAQ